MDLTTSYLGIELRNPIIAGASNLTASMDTMHRLEEAGAGALVVKSLFEEQIQIERFKLEEEMARYSEIHAEMVSMFPNVEHAGAEEHLHWVRRAKNELSIPVIASLNAVNASTWVEYARKLADTGVDALELNFYSVPRDPSVTGQDIEDEQVSIVRDVKRSVEIPVSVKLSPFYPSVANVVSRLDAEGVDGFVLFNRLFQPDIDPDSEQNKYPLNLSTATDSRLPLRYAGLLHGTVAGSLAASTGVMTGKDVARMVLAGADCVQVVSTLYRNKVQHLETMLAELRGWMEAKGYGSLGDFRGKLSRQSSNDPWAYARAQYVKVLLTRNPLGSR